MNHKTRNKLFKMGQLESYTIHDIFLVAILSGVLSTYFAEEIEATIESVAAYTYSANSFISKKRVAIAPVHSVTGAVGDSTHNSFNFLFLSKITFLSVEKSLNDRVIWQDPFLISWNSSRQSFHYLEETYKKVSA